MSILAANLRHLYQRRGVWLGYAMLAFFICISIMVPLGDPVAGEGKFIGLIALALMVGAVATVLQMEIMTRPFAFCLPGHRQVVRKFIFSIAVVTNLLGSALFLVYPRLPLRYAPVVVSSAFSAGLVFYLTGVWLALGSKQPLGFVGLLALGMFGGGLLNLHVLLEHVVINYPAGVITLGLVCSGAMWLYLNDENLARRNCLRPWMGFGDVFNREKLQRFQRISGTSPWKRLKDHPHAWVEDFFVGRMARQGAFSPGRFLWGSLYISFGLLISQWKNALLFVLFMAVFLGYMGSRMWAILVFVPVIMLQVYGSRPTLYSPMLTAGGREERFDSTLAVTVAGGGLLALFVAAAALVSVPLAAIIPEIAYRGVTLTYHVVGINAFYAPLVLLPVAGTIQLVFYRKPVLMILMLMGLVYLVMVVGMVSHNASAALGDGRTALAAFTFFWLVFVVVLHRIAMRRCLIR
ncbi:MAG: hypothetical protein JW955_21005 [Sedimentisphaerales bacterium]|nr:hypothetical protein [Sedimentisphaerales bacterium]